MTTWTPTEKQIQETHLWEWMTELNMPTYQDLHAWSVSDYQDFWQCVIEKLNIQFIQPPITLCDLNQGIESPQWLVDATMNITDSCFTAPPNASSLIYQDSQKQLKTFSYGDLQRLTHRVANGLAAKGFAVGDAIAIVMPMTIEAIAAYLGIIKMGGVVVSIADSFSSQEMSARLKIAKTKAIFTQDYSIRNHKKIDLYAKIKESDTPFAIVIPCGKTIDEKLRSDDLTWESFLSKNDVFTSVPCQPMDACNILFSSGTTGTPKAIPWNHTTAIKAASDAYFHHDIHAGNILAWPTNLGWMMGPWLIFAALINHATIALYTDAPTTREFGEFIQDAKVTMLGLVPTIVSAWRQTNCMKDLDWSAIRLFSSTGECSNPEDMSFLMQLGGGKPIIEYCGGTEIGGAYVTSTLIQTNYPSLFSTPAMGSDFILIDENGKPANSGEVAIIPPAIGLSTTLLNTDHHEVYYDNMPYTPDGKILRRHGDQLQRLENGYYTVLGRVDDTMNLGGIKISSAEIERVLVGLDGVIETAAVAMHQPGDALDHLVIYAVTDKNLDKSQTQKAMQERIHRLLNPLFKIQDVVFMKELPRTASNKIMRKELRKR